MTVDLTLYNGKVYAYGEVIEAGIAINDGKIVKIAKEANLPPASKKVNLRGLLAIPGLIDVHVHLRDQGNSHKETFLTGTAAAAAGGITLVVDMPNNDPVTMDVESLRRRMYVAEGQVLVNVAFYSAFPNDMSDVSSIVREGAVAFKLFLSERIGGVGLDDDSILTAFNKANEAGVIVAIHAESKSLIEKALSRLRDEGRGDIKAFLEAHSIEAEAEAVLKAVRLAIECDARIHICHLSSKEALTLIESAKLKGLRITCEVTPHHLLLTAEDLERTGPYALTTPPLRTNADVEALWKGLRLGLIDLVASDHAPHAIEEKLVESVWDVKPGVPGLETMLPLMLTQVNEGRLSIQDLVKLTSERPSEVFGFKGRGYLNEGNYADVVIVDLKNEYKVDASKFYSKAKFSPFDGWRVKGKPVKTFVNGQLIMDEGEIVAKPGSGRILRGRSY